jgi:hypothetical protein
LKNIKILVLCVVLVGTSIASASPISSIENLQMDSSSVLDPNGTFDGFIGFRQQGNWTTVGTINGTYELRNRFGRFNGAWSIQHQNQSASGTMRGGFGKQILIGRITIEGRNRTMPIIGFIGFRNEIFFGRYMSLVGPALYFKGTYT